MREILFKAKSIDDGEWVEGYVVRHRDNTYPHGFEMIDKNGINYDELDYFNPDFYSQEIDEETISQYTGFCDKNGNKIFENDLIGNPFNRVEFVGGSWCVNGDRPLFMFTDYEIVGNYFDK